MPFKQLLCAPFAFSSLILFSSVASADDYFADGKLAGELLVEVTETGGFVGVQSYSIKIGTEGSSRMESSIGRRPARVQEGTIAAGALETLGKKLAEAKFLDLPAMVKSSTKLPAGAADIPTIEAKITFGEHTVTASYVGFGLEKDPNVEQLKRVQAVIGAARKAASSAAAAER